jgi:hypothetical protein
METLLDRWLARALECYSEETVRFLGAEKDSFRNPVGHTLRENLAILLDQLLGRMEADAAQASLANILRIRAVQELTPSQAVQFIFQLRPLLRELSPQAKSELLDARIDQLALWAFEEYTRCRERIADIRISESRRGMAFAARRAPGGHESGDEAGLDI